MSDPGAPSPTPNPYAQPTPSQQPAGPSQQPPPAGGTPYPPPGGAPYPPPGGAPYPPSGGTPYPPGTGPYPAPGQYPPYGQNPWPTEPAQRKPGVNGFAIAALILGILPLFPLAIIFGIIALVQTSRTGQKGRGLAIAGLITGGLWLALVVGSIIWAVMDAAERDEDGQITEEGSVSTLDVQVGDCLNGLRATEDDETLTTLPAVPCDQPHEGEVYATFELEDGDYPGLDGITAAADEQCSTELQAFSQSAWDDRNIGLFYLYPEELGWPSDREVVCIAYAIEGEITGSLAE